MIHRSPFPEIDIPEIPLPEYLLQTAKDRLDKPALIDGPSGRTITYGQLAGAIRLVASSLAKRGFQKGDVFAIYSPNLPEYAIAFQAVALAGWDQHHGQPALHGAANWRTSSRMPAHVSADDAALPGQCQGSRGRKRAASRRSLSLAKPRARRRLPACCKSDGQLPPVQSTPSEDLVVLPYSSGTTGLPKGVMLTHYNLVANVAQCTHLEFDRGLDVRDRATWCWACCRSIISTA